VPLELDALVQHQAQVGGGLLRQARDLRLHALLVRLHLLQALVVAGSDEVLVRDAVQVHRRLEQLLELGQVLGVARLRQGLGEPRGQRAGVGPAVRAEGGLQGGQPRRGAVELAQILQRGGAALQLAREALHVGQAAQVELLQVGAQGGVRHERLHHVVPRRDGGHVQQGLLEPDAQQALAHGRLAAAHEPVERERVGGVGAAAQHVERALRRGVEPHVAPRAVHLQPPFAQGLPVGQQLAEGERARERRRRGGALQHGAVRLHRVGAAAQQPPQVLGQALGREGGLGAVRGQGPAARQHVGQALPLRGGEHAALHRGPRRGALGSGGLRGALGRGQQILGQHRLAGAQLQQRRLERAKVLVVRKLAGAQAAGGGVHVGQAHGAGAAHGGDDDRGDDGRVGEVAAGAN
jgi:hypothetical protein